MKVWMKCKKRWPYNNIKLKLFRIIEASPVLANAYNVFTMQFWIEMLITILIFLSDTLEQRSYQASILNFNSHTCSHNSF